MRALVSVSDKRGVVEFATALNEMGFEIISTSGTVAALRNSGLKVQRMKLKPLTSCALTSILLRLPLLKRA